MTAETEPTAIIAVRPSLCGNAFQFAEKRLERAAERLGYTVLATIDTDVIRSLVMLLTGWHPDAVITPTEAHINLAEVTRLCEVITLSPEALYSRDGYELLRPDDRSDRTLPQRIPGASGLALHRNSAEPRAATTADWDRLLHVLTGVRRARDETGPAT